MALLDGVGVASVLTLLVVVAVVVVMVGEGKAVDEIIGPIIEYQSVKIETKSQCIVLNCLPKSHPPDDSVSSSSQGGPGIGLDGPLQ